MGLVCVCVCLQRGMYVAGQPSTQPVRSFTYKTVPKFFANLPPDSPIRQDAPAFQYNPKWKGAAGGFACFDPFSVCVHWCAFVLSFVHRSHVRWL